MLMGISSLIVDLIPRWRTWVELILSRIPQEKDWKRNFRFATPSRVTSTPTKNNSRITAVVRGAVLYKLGLNYVKEHAMRVHYGVSSWVPFQEDVHPEDFRVEAYDGVPMCKNVMKWYVRKVSPHLT